MEQSEYVIFGELDPDAFEQIVTRLGGRYEHLRFGRQGDDWIWIDYAHGRIEIDTFGAMVLEVKGRRRDYGVAREIFRLLDSAWIRQVFMPPRMDLGR
ncbi:hypothetical protein [Zobellella maritima]|uniref:hypothetical protein n=1 Tax=Zobellella maritima TaxID=2059725 RepID=UPI000E308BC0|nr:hypothetical protein [Zobellella maritima]